MTDKSDMRSPFEKARDARIAAGAIGPVIPSDLLPFTELRCNSCGKRFMANLTHDCRVTRAEFDALQMDVRSVAAWLLAVNNGPHRDFYDDSESVQRMRRIVEGLR